MPNPSVALNDADWMKLWYDTNVTPAPYAAPADVFSNNNYVVSATATVATVFMFIVPAG